MFLLLPFWSDCYFNGKCFSIYILFLIITKFKALRNFNRSCWQSSLLLLLLLSDNSFVVQWFEMACKSLQGLVWIEGHTSSQTQRPYWSRHKSVLVYLCSKYLRLHIKGRGLILSVKPGIIICLTAYKLILQKCLFNCFSNTDQHTRSFFQPCKHRSWVKRLWTLAGIKCTQSSPTA